MSDQPTHPLSDGSGDENDGGWVSAEMTPIDVELNNSIVVAIDSVSAVWQMINPDNPEDEFAAPIMLITMFDRQRVAHTHALSMAACVALIHEVTSHMTHVMGNDISITNGTFTDEGLERLINDVMDQDEGGV